MKGIPENAFPLLTRVVTVDLGRNQISILQPQLATWSKKLKVLKAYDNQLTAVGAVVGELRELEVLHLYANHIGSLPEEMNNLRKLVRLNLSRNEILTLHASLFESCVLLEDLDLSSNVLVDIPATIGNLTRLKRLSLRHNRISVLPNTIGDIGPSLQFLDVHSNYLKTLPSEISKLTSLEELIIESNPFSSLVPEDVRKNFHSLMNFLERSHHLGVDASQCVILGSAVCKAKAGSLMSLKLYAADSLGNAQSVGGHQVQAILTRKSLLPPSTSDKNGSKELPGLMGSAAVKVVCSVADFHNGSYSISYAASKCGVYDLDISVNGAAVKHSPFEVTVTPGDPHAQACILRGEGLCGGVERACDRRSISPLRGLEQSAGASSPGKREEMRGGGGGGGGGGRLDNPCRVASFRTLTMEGWDNFGNRTLLKQSDVTSKMTGVCFLSPEISILPTGEAELKFPATRAGSYALHVLLNHKPLKGSPFRVVLQPTVLDVRKTSCYGTGLFHGVVGQCNTFVVQANDQHGNPLNSGGLDFDVKMHNGNGHVAKTWITDEENGQYTVSYTTTSPGTYTLHVKYDANDVPGSPFEVNIRA